MTMKYKIYTIIFLIFLFLVFLFYSLHREDYPAYKVLKVIEADTYYLDFNNNNKIDNDELVRLKNISAFTPLQNSFSKEKSTKLGIDTIDYLKVGFLARNWAVDNLTGKYIKVHSKVKNLKYNAYLIEADINGEDLGEFLLKNGLAYINFDCDNINYLPVSNIHEVKNNAKEISSLEFLILNLKSGVAHKPECDYAKILSNGELFLKKSFNSVVHYCKFCFNEGYSDNFTFNIPKSIGVYKKSVYKNLGYFEIYLINPLQYSKPSFECKSDFSKRLIKEIDSANKSIDVAMYTISEQKEIIDALKRAKERGINVRVVSDYYKNIFDLYPKMVQFAKDFDVHFDKTQTLMHNKFIIFDNKKVVTGSTNISSTDSGGYNANIALIFNSEEIASYYELEFNQMYSGKFSKKKEFFVPKYFTLGDYRIKVYFMPKSNVKNDYIIPALKNAKSEIFVSAFYLTDKNIILELLSAKRRNVNVLILLDALGVSNNKKQIMQLRNQHIPVAVENWGGKNHEKSILIDNNILITGSSNFSANGLYKNDENVVVIESSKVAKIYRDYYLFLFNSVDSKFLRAFPRAEGRESKNSCFDGIDNNHDGKTDAQDDGCKIY